ncbi:MAG: metallophosphatase, partial [Selenomonadales bacterium]|nr:metallophosphatase [Selenomonadales bacterium]
MKPIIRAFAICWAIFSLTVSALAQPTEISLRIIGMNDFHGALVETSSYAGAAKVASAVEKLKREADNRAVVLSAGDMMQGSIESNLERGQTVIEMMNVIGIDAMTLGNHEFDWGLEVLQERIGEMQFDCLAANVKERDSGEVPRWLKPYTMLERDGLRIGVVGLLTMDTATSVNPKHIRTLKIADPMLTARDAVREARAEGADIIILLVHMACYQDEMTGRLSGEAAELAAIDGVDVIVSGHSHTLVNGYAEGIPVVQAGAKGTYLDVVDLVYSTEQKKIISCRAELHKVDGKALLPCRKTEAAVKRAA